MRTTSRLKWFLSLALVISASVAFASLFGESSPNNLGSVVKTDLIQKVTVAGTVIPVRRTVITPPYNAYVKKVFVKVGDKVKAGQAMVLLVQSLRNLAEPEFPMRAPFDGTVVQIPKSEGEYVEIQKEGNAILRIDDLSKLFAVCEVPESSIANMHKGQEVVLKPNSGGAREYKGIIRDVFLAAKEKAQGGWGRPGERVNFEIRVEILDADEKVRPGMSAIVDIITQKREKVLTLRHEFIEKNAGGYFVTLESGERKKIDVGISNEEAFEVTAGITENSRVKMVDFASLPQVN